MILSFFSIFSFFSSALSHTIKLNYAANYRCMQLIFFFVFSSCFFFVAVCCCCCCFCFSLYSNSNLNELPSIPSAIISLLSLLFLFLLVVCIFYYTLLDRIHLATINSSEEWIDLRWVIEKARLSKRLKLLLAVQLETMRL